MAAGTSPPAGPTPPSRTRGLIDSSLKWFSNAWAPIAERGRGPLMQLMMLTLWAGVLYLVWLRLGGDGSNHGDRRPLIYIVLGACALPKVLCFCVALIVTRDIRKRAFDLTRSVQPKLFAAVPLGAAPDDLDRIEEEALKIANQTWTFEMDEIERLQDRLFQHAGMYGFFSSIALSGAVVMIGPAVLGGQGAIDPMSKGLAATIAAAAVVSFAKDFGRMVMRAASRDLSAQMIAWSTKRLLVVLVAAALAALLALTGKDATGASFIAGKTGVPFAAIGMGAAIALLGERAVEAISDRAATALGITPLKPANAFGLQQLDGVDEEIILRFAEEGIDSVHALAFFPTPRLFFSTKFSIQRICDWQDQALLATRVGPVRAQTFRDQFGAKGIIAAREVARTLTTAAAPVDIEDIRKVLGLATATQANFFLRDLAFDEVAATLAIYRSASPTQILLETPGAAG